MDWGDGLRVKPGVLHARASSLRTTKTQLESKISAHENIDMGSWRGDAQRAQHSAHRKLLTTLHSHARRIPPAADALQSAADSFDQIQRAQQNLISRAASYQYAIQDSGWLRDMASGLSKANPIRVYQRVRIQGSVFALIARLNFTDVALAGRLKVSDIAHDALDGLARARDSIIDLLQLGADKLLSGIEWTAGKIKDGLAWGKRKIEEGWEWTKDRAEEAWDWTKDRAEEAWEFGKDVVADIKERTGHAIPAAQRLFETLKHPPQWVNDFFQKGEIPQLSEVVGSALYVGGQAFGIPFNFFTNEDQHFFDDGRAWMAGEADVKDHPLETDRFSSVNDVINPMMDVYNSRDNDSDRLSVQVTPVIGDDGTVRYIVSIPGTSEDLGSMSGWNGQASGTDWAANLKGVGFGNTAATESIMNSIDQAIQKDQAMRGISGEKPEVLLSGHSQGGIIAGNIANSEDFANKYDVGGVISAGSPVETLGVPKDIPVYNYQNQFDPVPRADLEGRNVELPGGVVTVHPNENVHNITFPDDGNRDVGHTHNQDTYRRNIEGLQSDARNPGLAGDRNVQAQRAMDEELGRFYNGQVDNAYRVQYGRETN